MKVKIAIILLLCVSFLSCTTKKKKITADGILTKEELVSVLYEIHMLDATASTYNSINKTNFKLSSACYDSVVFAKHECNDSIFKKSVEVYTLEGYITDIYNEVIDSLSKTKTLMEKNVQTQVEKK